MEQLYGTCSYNLDVNNWYNKINIYIFVPLVPTTNANRLIIIIIIIVAHTVLQLALHLDTVQVAKY